MISPGWCFTVRGDDDSWWAEIDPNYRERNRRIQAHMDLVRAHNAPYVPEPPQQKDDADVHPWFRYALKVGWPAALATAIVGWWLFEGSTLIKEAIGFQRQVLQVSQMMQEEHQTIRDRLDRSERMQWVMVDIMRANCVNNAQTTQERQSCLSAGSSR